MRRASQFANADSRLRSWRFKTRRPQAVAVAAVISDEGDQSWEPDSRAVFLHKRDHCFVGCTLSVWATHFHASPWRIQVEESTACIRIGLPADSTCWSTL